MKNILNEIKELQEKIEHKEEYILHLQEVLTTTTQKLSGMPKSNIKQRHELLHTEKLNVENELSELKEKQADCQITLNKYLAEKIEDSRVYSVMVQRYVLLKKFSDIVNDMHFSESVVFRLHRQGLKILGLK